MRRWDAQQVARAAGARLLRGPVAGVDGPLQTMIDSRKAGPGTLFVGIPGEHADGGSFAASALAAGAWGVLVAPDHADGSVPGDASLRGDGAVLVADDPLKALQHL